MKKKIILLLLILFAFFVTFTSYAISNKDVKKELKKYLDSKEVEKLIENIKNGTGSNIVIVDVRPENVYNNAHIPTAINIPNGLINENQTYLKDKDLILYCETGGRVELAKKNLIKNGFQKNRMLNFGGFKNYKGNIEKIEK